MKKFLFILIFGLAVFLRFFQLASVPPSPSLDEATIGWNAYSLLVTGHDEYGYHFPILLRAYDDYRPALYVYLVIPFIKFFGLSAFAVRLPSVLLSLITLIASYFTVKVLFKNYQYKYVISFSTMLLVAISPLCVYISRLGHEVNPGLTFSLLGTLFFLTAVSYGKRQWMLVISSICYSLSFYTYQSEKVFVPCMVLLLVLFYYPVLWAMKKQVVLALVVGLVLTLPILLASFSPGALYRLKGTSVFTDNPMYSQSAMRLLHDKQTHNVIGQIIDNRRFVSLEIFSSNYFSHFNPVWLYTNSGDESFKVPHLGLFYLWELPLFLIGLIFLWRMPIPKKIKLLPLGWIFIAFLAPGITTQAPHAMRAFNIVPVPQLVESIGVVAIVIFLKKLTGMKGIILGSAVGGLLLVWSIWTLSYNYFIIFPKQDSKSFEYALGNALHYVIANKKDFRKIIISNTDNTYQSYMFYLFYSAYDPAQYAKEGGTKSGGFAQTHTFSNIEFRPISFMKENKDTLLVGNPTEILSPVKRLKTYTYLNGQEGVVIAKK